MADERKNEKRSRIRTGTPTTGIQTPVTSNFLKTIDRALLGASKIKISISTLILLSLLGIAAVITAVMLLVFAPSSIGMSILSYGLLTIGALLALIPPCFTSSKLNKKEREIPNQLASIEKKVILLGAIVIVASIMLSVLMPESYVLLAIAATGGLCMCLPILRARYCAPEEDVALVQLGRALSTPESRGASSSHSNTATQLRPFQTRELDSTSSESKNYGLQDVPLDRTITDTSSSEPEVREVTGIAASLKLLFCCSFSTVSNTPPSGYEPVVTEDEETQSLRLDAL